jgi:hypothetical protein
LIAQHVESASDLLKKKKIRHLEVTKVDAEGKPPIVVQKRIPKGSDTYSEEEAKMTREQLAALGKWSDQHERALAKLLDEVAAADLVWLDPHVGNVYFYKEADELVCGILDVDRIADAKNLSANPFVDEWLALHQAFPAMFGIKTYGGVKPKDRFKTPHEIMAKIMESKGYYRYVDGKFVPRLVDPQVLRDNHFPLEQWGPKKP